MKIKQHIPLLSRTTVLREFYFRTRNHSFIFRHSFGPNVESSLLFWPFLSFLFDRRTLQEDMQAKIEQLEQMSFRFVSCYILPCTDENLWAQCHHVTPMDIWETNSTIRSTSLNWKHTISKRNKTPCKKVNERTPYICFVKFSCSYVAAPKTAARLHSLVIEQWQKFCCPSKQLHECVVLYRSYTTKINKFYLFSSWHKMRHKYKYFLSARSNFPH